MEKNILSRAWPLFVLLPTVTIFLITLSFAQASNGDETPEWLKRTEFSVQLESEQNPRFYLQTVQPLYQDGTKTNTFFIQPRATLQDNKGTYNLGFGYRRLSSENLLLGVNLFYDYQDKHRHSRMGAGLEALGQIFETRANLYLGGISNNVEVERVATGVIIERVANGADLEFGMPVPYMPFLKMYGSGSWFDYDRTRDRYGWKGRFEAKLNEYVKLELYSWDDNKGDTEYGGRIRFNIAFGNPFDITDAFTLSDEPFPKKDLSEEVLIPVEREFNIIVERYIETGGLTVEAGRS